MHRSLHFPPPHSPHLWIVHTNLHAFSTSLCRHRMPSTYSLWTILMLLPPPPPPLSQVRRFWRAFRTMSDADRSLFIRFAWGRARLPRAEHWTAPFKITRRGGGDNQLPIAHTCFFQIELPEYSTDDIARSRLIAAANFGLGGFLIA